MTGYFNLYPTSIIVKGFIRATINDVNSGFVMAIPIQLADMFDNQNSLSMDTFASSFSDDEQKILHSIIRTLIDKNIGALSSFQCDGFNVKLRKRFSTPFEITNIILEINEIDRLALARVFKEIDVISIRHLEIRLLGLYKLEDFDFIFKLVGNSMIKSFNLILSYDHVKRFEVSKLISYRSNRVIFYNSDRDDNYLYKDTDIIYVKQKGINKLCCGVVSQNYFTLNIRSFTESFNFNSCLNRKISIDAVGNIKNCPSMKESYGNIKDTTLAEAIEKPGFKKYWDINKDKIHVCKDCEFRHICTDCRAYVEDPDDILSKPLKCGYNPYTGEWSEWSTNPLKQKAIDFYGMREMVSERSNQREP